MEKRRKESNHAFLPFMIFHVHAVRHRCHPLNVKCTACAPNRNPKHAECVYSFITIMYSSIRLLSIAWILAARRTRSCEKLVATVAIAITHHHHHHRSRDSYSVKQPTKPICSRRRRQNDSNWKISSGTVCVHNSFHCYFFPRCHPLFSELLTQHDWAEHVSVPAFMHSPFESFSIDGNIL